MNGVRVVSLHHGRKGRPSSTIPPGETVVLADLDGPGTIRHVWMTFPPAPPETMRALWMEVFYDGAAGTERVGAVPRLLRHAARASRPVRVGTDVCAGRSRLQLVSPDAVRATRTCRGHELCVHTDAPLLPDRLHARARAQRHGRVSSTWRSGARTQPCSSRDFVIADGLDGPGRFVGCNVGVRVLDEGMWYGEGEMKMYRDGDAEFPTICGTGLGGLRRERVGPGHAQRALRRRALERGAGIIRAGRVPGIRAGRLRGLLPLAPRRPDHVPRGSPRHDPADRGDVLRPGSGSGDGRDTSARTRPPAPAGGPAIDRASMVGGGLAERVDDYCATSYVYCLRRASPSPASTSTHGARRHRPPRLRGAERDRRLHRLDVVITSCWRAPMKEGEGRRITAHRGVPDSPARPMCRDRFGPREIP